MKTWSKLVLLSVLTFIPGLSPFVHACDIPEGFHEFVTFGDKSVFLSHYPMFGSIHSYQVVLKADFFIKDRNVNSEFIAIRNANPSAEFETSPVRKKGENAYGVLPDYAKVGSTFEARIHYEAAPGKDVSAFPNETVTVKITEVILNRLINQPKEGTVRPSEMKYFYFGNSDEAYLVHQMYWDPDFDQVIRVKPIEFPTNINCPRKTPTVFTITAHKDIADERLKANESFSAHAGCVGTLSLKAMNEIRQDAMKIQL